MDISILRESYFKNKIDNKNQNIKNKTNQK